MLKTPPRLVGPTPPRLDFDSNGMSMTPEEFDAVEDYDECFRYELIRGVVIVGPMSEDWHAALIDETNYLVRDYVRSNPSGTVVDATLPNRYVFTWNGNRRLADRIIWVGLGRRPNPKSDVPAIAVEFVSKSRRDRHRDYVEKREEYREAGVKEYWIIDRFRRAMTVSSADGSERVCDEAVRYTTPLLPGFELPLTELFAIADRWDEEPTE
ncbi:MAG: Uma2 family endonuclease [Planctomycetaceae bacterium]